MHDEKARRPLAAGLFSPSAPLVPYFLMTNVIEILSVYGTGEIPLNG